MTGDNAPSNQLIGQVNDFINAVQDDTFTGVWMLVAMWDHVHPYPHGILPDPNINPDVNEVGAYIGIVLAETMPPHVQIGSYHHRFSVVFLHLSKVLSDFSQLLCYPSFPPLLPPPLHLSLLLSLLPSYFSSLIPPIGKHIPSNNYHRLYFTILRCLHLQMWRPQLGPQPNDWVQCC